VKIPHHSVSVNKLKRLVQNVSQSLTNLL